MKLNVGHKLFLAVLLVVGLVIATMVGTASVSLRQGYSSLAEQLTLVAADERSAAVDRPGLNDESARRAAESSDADVGYLVFRVPSPGGDIEKALVDNSLRVLAFVGLGALFLSTISAWLLAAHFVWPLLKLGGAMHQLAAGNLTTRITCTRTDEFGALIRDFNRLGSALEQNEILRRRWSRRPRTNCGRLSQS